MIEYYDQIFKRKSFHLFRGVGQEIISDNELDNIREAFGMASENQMKKHTTV